MALPGDDLVAEPAEQTTRAVTIDAEPHAVWPCIVQIGADRGGFYSYERLENLFGLGITTATCSCRRDSTARSGTWCSRTPRGRAAGT